MGSDVGFPWKTQTIEFFQKQIALMSGKGPSFSMQKWTAHLSSVGVGPNRS